MRVGTVLPVGQAGVVIPPRANHTVTQCGFDSVLIYGGDDGVDKHSDVWLVDTKYRNVTLLNNSSPQRINHTATFYGGRLYVFGGISLKGITNSLMIYDLDLDIWIEGTPSPSPRSQHSVHVIDDYLVVLGGIDDGALRCSEIMFYNFKKNSWSISETEMLGISGHSSILNDRKITLIGDKFQVIEIDEIEAEENRKTKTNLITAEILAIPYVGSVKLVVNKLVYLHGGLINDTVVSVAFKTEEMTTEEFKNIPKPTLVNMQLSNMKEIVNGFRNEDIDKLLGVSIEKKLKYKSYIKNIEPKEGEEIVQFPLKRTSHAISENGILHGGVAPGTHLNDCWRLLSIDGDIMYWYKLW